jgi:hypothetical protein
MTAFRIYRSHFPFAAPEQLDVVRAATITEARVAAKRRWPGIRLLVSRLRSPSSTAYRQFLAQKRAARWSRPSDVAPGVEMPTKESLYERRNVK